MDRNLVKNTVLLIMTLGWVLFVAFLATFSCNDPVELCSSNLTTVSGISIFFVSMVVLTLFCIAIMIWSTVHDRVKRKNNAHIKKEYMKRPVYMVLAVLMIFMMATVLFVQNEINEGANHFTDDILNASSAAITLAFLALAWGKRSFVNLTSQDKTIGILYLSGFAFQTMVILSNLPFQQAYIQELMIDEIPGFLLSLLVYVNIFI